MRALASFSTLCAVMLFSALFAADGERYALLVGVGTYRSDSGLNKLKYPDSDMRALKAAFQSIGFEEHNIRLLVNGSADDRFNPRRENIERELKLLLANKRPEDLVIVALSGHGLQPRAKDSAYFCPSDALVKNPATWLDLNSVFEQLKDCKAGGKLLIADCCRDDPALANTKGLPEDVQSVTRPGKLKPPQNVAALFSCGNGEAAFEEDELSGGVFMHYLIEGLKGKAALNGEIEIKSLASYLQRNVYDYVSARRGVSQVPAFKMDSDKPMVLAKIDLERALTLDLDGGVKMEFVKIPAGAFEMGSPEGEKERSGEEKQHTVEIGKPFYMGKFTVTQEQYEAITGENPSSFNGAKNPVDTVSWEDAVRFCEKLSKKVGKTVLLPTEAQWEYACRAGTETPFYFGETISADQANYDGSKTYGNGVNGEFRQKTTPIRTFKPNAFGLYDMHGNVLQWCQDWYDKDYYANSPRINPANNLQGDMKARVLRGGCWNYYPWDCRSASRTRFAPDFRHRVIGFRVCSPLE